MNIQVNWGRSLSAGLTSCATAETTFESYCMMVIRPRVWLMRHSPMSMPSKLMSTSGSFVVHEIADPEHMLEGAGKFMRHVKLRPERDVDATALMKLVATAYSDMKERLRVQ